jgi:hypothetical protein
MYVPSHLQLHLRALQDGQRRLMLALVEDGKAGLTGPVVTGQLVPLLDKLLLGVPQR